MVDIGVTFADDTVPGVDLIYPDPGFIEQRKDNLMGIVLTHAHEDHIGAIAHLWPKLGCKIYATPFTAVLIREKFREKHIDITNDLQIVELNGKVNLDPFEIEYITLTHSILEPNGLKIKTPLGVVLHTGDWKVDPNPLIGDEINAKRLKEIGEEGVLAMICDSTNVFSAGRSGSEASDPDLPALKTFVESQIIARTPSSPISFNLLALISSPINGFGSTFQSPVCRTTPRGVLIFKPFGSKIECVSVMYSISKGSKFTFPFSSTICKSLVISICFSLNFSLINTAVNGVA